MHTMAASIQACWCCDVCCYGMLPLLLQAFRPAPVPLTLLRLNSFTRASSGVMVAHLMPTLYFCRSPAARSVQQPCIAADPDAQMRGMQQGDLVGVLTA
jgi:hypothetical protein